MDLDTMKPSHWFFTWLKVMRKKQLAPKISNNHQHFTLNSRNPDLPLKELVVQVPLPDQALSHWFWNMWDWKGVTKIWETCHKMPQVPRNGLNLVARDHLVIVLWALLRHTQTQMVQLKWLHAYRLSNKNHEARFLFNQSCATSLRWCLASPKVRDAGWSSFFWVKRLKQKNIWMTCEYSHFWNQGETQIPDLWSSEMADNWQKYT